MNLEIPYCKPILSNGKPYDNGCWWDYRYKTSTLESYYCEKCYDLLISNIDLRICRGSIITDHNRGGKMYYTNKYKTGSTKRDTIMNSDDDMINSNIMCALDLTIISGYSNDNLLKKLGIYNDIYPNDSFVKFKELSGLPLELLNIINMYTVECQS